MASDHTLTPSKLSVDVLFVRSTLGYKPTHNRDVLAAWPLAKAGVQALKLFRREAGYGEVVQVLVARNLVCGTFVTAYTITYQCGNDGVGAFLTCGRSPGASPGALCGAFVATACTPARERAGVLALKLFRREARHLCR